MKITSICYAPSVQLARGIAASTLGSLHLGTTAFSISCFAYPSSRLGCNGPAVRVYPHAVGLRVRACCRVFGDFLEVLKSLQKGDQDK